MPESPINIAPESGPAQGTLRREGSRYRKLWWYSVLLTAFVALLPLTVMMGVNHIQFRRNLQAELRYDLSRMLSDTRRSLEFVIRERISALDLVIQDKPKSMLHEDTALARTFQHLKASFGGFVDLGLIDADGVQRHYVGPYSLLGTDYHEEDWFHEVVLRGVHVSNVFLGHRNFPHFVIAVKHDEPDGSFFILRAAIDMDMLTRQIEIRNRQGADDAFIIDRQGILQTQSQSHGDLLTPCTLPVPLYSPDLQVVREKVDEGEILLGYSYVENSPFILMAVRRPQDHVGGWIRARSELVGFYLVSVILIVIVVLWSASFMVRQIRQSDERRAKMLHNIEYTNKMATIGRLAASVAHEINNPLAIINEKAGLLKDLAVGAENHPYREKSVACVDSIIKSVERCSAVTHRLLGFTRRMETRQELIDLRILLHEVFGFLGKEAEHRNIRVNFEFDPELPAIVSDRGQLQQIFLNIINNAFAAVEKGGQIDITTSRFNHDRIAVHIRDTGSGIAEENLQHIFEPFFSTKGEFGTGLGLSITYGIVKKLGGDIRVNSTLGEGSTFTVILPMKPAATLE